MLPRISVVVCTYNRADLLANVLQTLCEQTIDISEYEVIIVDNNSTDNTRAVAEDFCRRYPHVRYCLETQQGLSHARNRGWQEARGEYVGYIDDDGKAPPEWLVVARDVINQIAPAAFGGSYFAFYNTPKPRWFRDEYGTHDLGAQAHVLDPNEYVSGGNLFFRRAVLEVLGGFDPALGMSGQRIAYGEETALLRRMRTEMPDQMIYYEPRLYVYHLVAARKMALSWIIRQRFASGRYSYMVLGEASSAVLSKRRLLKQMLHVLLLLSRGLLGGLRRDQGRYPFIQNYWHEQAFRHLQTLGALYAQYESGRKWQRTKGTS